MAFKIKNKQRFDRKMKDIQRAGRSMQKDLAKELPISYIFALGKNTPLAQPRDQDGKKIKGRGLAKAAWYQMLPNFGKKTNTNRRLPPGSSTVQNKVRSNKSVAVLTNAIDYIGYLDKGGKNTPPANILAKSRIQMEVKAEKQLKRHGKILKRVWRR
jgi:hypothetical protein|tara:strand:+ start:9495 stop:9965 length:471 start_codon:yes stop_codon:yes gene_type:complete